VNVGEVIAAQLENWGVQRVYGLPGSSFLPLLEALERRGSPRFVTVADEANAALMASAHAKLTGGLGVCLAHAGPGAARLAAGLWDARKDQVPVLALTGQVPEERIGTAYKQASDETRMMGGPAGLSLQLNAAGQTVEILTQAMRHAVALGDSAHVALPEDLLAADCGACRPTSPAPYVQRAPALAEDRARIAAGLLAAARRPVILMGRGALGARREVLELAERLQAPVITTLFAKGALSEEHPLVVGPLGEAGTDAAGEAARSADILLAAGSTWLPRSFLPDDVQVIQVDQRATAVHAGVADLVAIVADARQALAAIVAELPELSRSPRRRPEAQGAPADTDEGVHPAAIMQALRSALPDGAVVAVDTGLDTLWYGRAFPARSETTLVSGRWRTMGFALPAAIAAKLERPRAPVVAIAGDGGFMTSMQEFPTAVEERLAIAVLVLRNGTLGEERGRARLSGYRRTSPMRLPQPDFALFARACGGQGLSARTSAELRRAIGQALAADGPALVDVATAYAVPDALRPVAAAPAARRGV